VSDRQKLPARRGATTIEIQHEGAPITITIGEHDDGRLGEVFVHLSNRRHSTPLEALARDAAILISIALQYGAPIEVLRAAVTRDTAEGDYGAPSSIVGAVLDGMAR
jgi:hypothetical protein